MNWFAGDEDGAGPILRKEIHDIINPATRIFGFQLPVYEKRKRLEILLGPVLMKWVEATEKGPDIFGTLLRVNCRNMKADECSRELATGKSSKGVRVFVRFMLLKSKRMMRLKKILMCPYSSCIS
jgi:hypothetical protein